MLDPSDPPATILKPGISGFEKPTRSLDDRLGPVATWRGLTTIDPATGDGSLSLLTGDGGVHRFRLSARELATLAGVCVSQVADYAVRMNSHSDRSSGSPASAVSRPLDGVKV